MAMFPNLKDSLAPLTLRLGLASIFLYHGYLKIVYHGGTGWSPDLPVEIQLVVCWSEFLGGLAIAFGLLTRVVALGFTVIMVGAILTVTGQRDFVYMQYFARDIKGYVFRQVGYEYNFAIIVICLTLIIVGGGRWSADRYLFPLLFRRKKTAAAPAIQVPATPEPVGASAQPGSFLGSNSR